MLPQKSLADVKTKLEKEIATLHEQKQGLQDTVDLRESTIKTLEAASTLLEEEHSQQLQQQQSMFADRLSESEDRVKQLARSLDESHGRATTAEALSKALNEQLHQLQAQLQVAQQPSLEAEAELCTLKSRVAVLEDERQSSALRARTIESRYHAGDLVRRPRIRAHRSTDLPLSLDERGENVCRCACAQVARCT